MQNSKEKNIPNKTSILEFVTLAKQLCDLAL